MAHALCPAGHSHHPPVGQEQGDPDPAAAQDHQGSPDGNQGVPGQCLHGTQAEPVP